MARSLLAGLLLSALAATGAAAAERATSYVYPPFKHTLGMQRVGELELKLFLGPGAKVENPQGICAGKPASRDDAKTDRDDDELTLVLVNSGRGELLYNPSQTSLKRYGRKGSGEGEFLDPRGVDMDREGRVAVADTGNHRVALLGLGEDALQWTGAIDSVEGAPFAPSDVAFAAGMLWVTDLAGGRILRFKPDGEWVDAWAPRGDDALDGPLALAVADAKDPWNRMRRFALVLVDRQGQRVRVYDERARVLHEANVADLLPGPARLGYPVIDLHGQILLPDSTGGRLLKLNRDLSVLDVLDHLDDDSPLRHPSSLALYRRFGQLFVVETRGGSYAWTGTDVKRFEALRVDGDGRPGLQLDYFLTEPSLVRILLAAGGEERELLPERRREAGERRDWVALPEPIPARATVILRATPTYSARKQLTVERRAPLPAGDPAPQAAEAR
ncbi:MAG: NHL repeat-containing protein [Candidatus Krumholzibacteriia bacterium]